jgi:hypothetical protein
MKGKIVINASPLILLHKTDLQFLLPALFSSIIIPDAVMDEISVHEEDDIARKIRSQPDFTMCTVALEPLVQSWDLGKGETDVISFAYHDPTYIPVLDDSAAKACCTALVGCRGRYYTFPSVLQGRVEVLRPLGDRGPAKSKACCLFLVPTGSSRGT